MLFRSDVTSTTIFEIEHGLDAQMSAATGLPVGKSLHFLLNNVTEKDNRIPARGFRGAVYEAIGAKVVGANYEDEQYWAEDRYTIPANAVRAEVRLFHQTTSKEYIEFLRNENVTDNKGVEVYQLWDMFGRSRPVEMGLVDLDLGTMGTLAPRPLALGKLRQNGGRAEITFAGSSSATGGGATITVTGGSPGDIMVLFGSPGQGSMDRAGGIVNVISGSVRYATVFLDASGEAVIPVSFGPGDVVRDITFQAFFRDTVDQIGRAHV